ncbi:hypothetical protein POVCU2_0021640 [Plasmodium ovale curtisi]|uniref:Uncharacterized protein n=1 Tax=Plasmodium ovale curtisi TaxID=864141 RepID=A0A1A8WIC1_PLAOA|nr:hypothetical protein POVCU2_0021640 [Plasmodium ovale curtisi]SBS90990.1 hypothetical protein POVCU1_019530 [Plasmodium ovale curtisi]
MLVRSTDNSSPVDQQPSKEGDLFEKLPFDNNRGTQSLGRKSIHTHTNIPWKEVFLQSRFWKIGMISMRLR